MSGGGHFVKACGIHHFGVLSSFIYRYGGQGECLKGEEESQQEASLARKVLSKSKHRARDSHSSGDVSELITKAVDNAFSSKVMDIIKAFCPHGGTRASTSKHAK